MVYWIISFFLILNFTAYAEVYQKAGEEGETQLEKLLESPQLRPLREACEEERKTDSNLIIGDCVWAAMDDSQKDEIREILGQDQEDPQYQGIELGGQKINQDPALIKVQEHLNKLLQEAMYGEVQASTVNIVDHNVFYEMFETKVSKNIIEGISSFCIEAVKDAQHIYIISRDKALQAATRERKIDELKQPGQAAYKKWTTCAGEFKDVCKNPIRSQNPDTAPYACNGGSPCGNPEAKTKACEVLSIVEKARKELIAIAEIKEANKNFMDKEGSLRLGGIAKGQTVKTYTGSTRNGDKSIDELTTVTSGDFVKGYKEENEKLQEKFKEECTADSHDSEFCKQFISDESTKEEQQKAIDNYSIASKVMEEKIVTNLESDPEGEELTKYLKEEGYSDDKIKEIVDGDPSIKGKVIADIKKTYSAKRLAVIKSMKARLEGESVTTDPQGNASAQNAIDQINKELTQNTKEYSQLIHFNNIVSSYISLDTGGGNKSNNLTAANLELGNLAEDFEQNKDAIQGEIDSAGLTQSSESGSLQLGVDELNKEFLKHTDK